MGFKIITEYPVAVNSLDHIYPTGAVNDNSTNLDFIEDVENYFGNKINFLDLGCAGGQLVVDFANRGHNAIGLEGSSRPAELGLFNWPEYHNKNLFMCDIGKPFFIETSEPVGFSIGKGIFKMRFDLITAWEVLEHLKLYEIGQLFSTIRNALTDDGLFVGSINWHKAHSKTDPSVVLHRTRFQKDFWEENIFPDYFEILQYPFNNAVRGLGDPKAFLFALKLK